MYDKNFDNPIYVRNMVSDKVDFYLSVLRKADEEYHNGTDVKASKPTDKEYDLLRGLIIVYNKLEPTISIQEYLDCVGAKVE